MTMRFRFFVALFCIGCVAFCDGAAQGETKNETQITLCAVGDILLDRGVASQIERRGLPYPFQHLAPILKKADIAFGNLECPLAARKGKVRKAVAFQARPAYARCLRDAGLDILSLANNHTLDCGRDGLRETMQHLRRHHLQWCGIGHTRHAAQSPTIVTRKGLRVAFVAFSEFASAGVTLRADAFRIALASPENVRRSVASARTHADVVVASFHWGNEYSNTPRASQIRLAQIAVDAGAALVLGHHPHVLQGWQILTARHSRVTQNRGKSNVGPRRALVVYSLGNFVFDPARSRGHMPTETIALRCGLGKRGVLWAQAVPLRIENSRPRAATHNEARAILSRLRSLSGVLSTRMTRGKVELTQS